MSGFIAGTGWIRSLGNSEARKPGRHASAASAGIMMTMAMAAGMLVAGRAMAATADGTLITNVACATYGTATIGCDFPLTYCVTANVLVVNPNIQINKSASPSIECSGATVTFCIWVANASAYTSAFNVSVCDIIPGTAGVMSYQQGQTNWITGTTGATVTLGYGAQIPWNISQTQYWAECPSGQTGPYAIRWVVSMIGPGKSALLCWKASIL